MPVKASTCQRRVWPDQLLEWSEIADLRCVHVSHGTIPIVDDPRGELRRHGPSESLR